MKIPWVLGNPGLEGPSTFMLPEVYHSLTLEGVTATRFDLTTTYSDVTPGTALGCCATSMHRASVASVSLGQTHGQSGNLPRMDKYRRHVRDGAGIGGRAS